jgi:metallo-beta-lactamase family protein
MKIHFHGAAQTVTGSAHYFEINGHKLLLDCGLFQGRRSEAQVINREFRFPPHEIDAVILSHAHIDHSGNLPNLVKSGYAGPIHATGATADLSTVMLRDSGHIQEYDVQWVNKMRKRKGEPPIDPLYTQEDAESAAAQFVQHSLNTPFEPIPGVSATFIEAGHILGSAAIRLEVDEGGRKTALWFSGDIGRTHLPLIMDPVMPYNSDYLIMECTYGHQPHESPAQAQEDLLRILTRTLGRGGKVIIPAFAVGRTQELVYAIHRFMDAGDIPRTPVYVDSPLAVNVTDIFRDHPECFDEEALRMMRDDKHRAALGFDDLTYVRSVEESKALNERSDPMIIISASGMIEAGRILHHLRNNIHDPKATLLIVSWQAPHTLGRRMLEGKKQVKIFGEPYDVKMEVQRVKGFSAHGGQDMLRDYALAIRRQVKDIFLVHGEQDGADGLTEALTNWNFKKDMIHYPARGTTFDTRED